MEELQKAAGLAQDSKIASKITDHFNNYYNTTTPSSSAAAALSSSSEPSSRLLLTRPPRYLVSGWTCFKLCGICFVAGMVVGYTLKRRVSNWASKLLRRLKDD